MLSIFFDAQPNSRECLAKAETCEVQVLSESSKDQKFEELCLLNAHGGQSVFESRSVERTLPDLMKKAWACGVDAIGLKTSKEGGCNFAGTSSSI
jgi:creatinine amidohydrolase/Fe(II)-dependent formamide hydrolase-like protein